MGQNMFTKHSGVMLCNVLVHCLCCSLTKVCYIHICICIHIYIGLYIVYIYIRVYIQYIYICTYTYHTTPHHTIPYHTIPYHTIPYHTTPHHTIPYQPKPFESAACGRRRYPAVRRIMGKQNQAKGESVYAKVKQKQASVQDSIKPEFMYRYHSTKEYWQITI